MGGRLRARISCAFRGHDWEYGLPSGHSWCRRCKHYDDDRSIERVERAVRLLRAWSPIWISFTSTDVALHAGWAYRRRSPVKAHLRVHYRSRGPFLAFDGELPGVTIGLDVLALSFSLGLGFGYQDEDGNRTLAWVNLHVEPGDFTRRFCRIFGHVAREPYPSGTVYCARCDEQIVGPYSRAAA